jgi:hypothetical protein
LDKAALRVLHASAVEYRIGKAKGGLVRHEARLLGHVADHRSLDTAKIDPCVVQVHTQTEQELLFRWARLHWSIPISSGYGRRVRFLVVDRHNGKLIGLIGLGDPVFALGPREECAEGPRVEWRMDVSRRKPGGVLRSAGVKRM